MNYSQSKYVIPFISCFLIDEKDNHEYFCHKYNVSNELKDDSKFFAKNLKLLQKIKIFLKKI